MSHSQNARGLSAFSLVVLAAGLLFASVGVSPLFAEETLANGSDVNQVVDSDVAGESDSGSDAPSAFLTEGQSKDSLASIGDSNSATSEGDISVDDAAIKTGARFLMVRHMFLPAVLLRVKSGTLREGLLQMAPMCRYTVRI